MPIVKNVHDGKRPVPRGFASWLDFWEYKTVIMADICYCCGKEPAEVGGHVKKISGGNEWYIVPLCYSCNNTKDPNHKANSGFYVDQSDMVRIP